MTTLMYVGILLIIIINRRCRDLRIEDSSAFQMFRSPYSTVCHSNIPAYLR